MDDEDDIVEVRVLDEFDDLEAELDHNSDEIKLTLQIFGKKQVKLQLRQFMMV